MLFKLSNVDANLVLTVGYLKPAFERLGLGLLRSSLLRGFEERSI